MFEKGFLKSDKGKKAIQKDEQPSSSADSHEPPAERPKLPEEESIPIKDLHRIPDQVRAELDAKGDDRRRIVFQLWPRAPDAKPMLPDGSRGRNAPNGYPIWGDNLYSFYRAYRLPGSVTTSSASLLAARMRNLGETETAAHEIYWADKEDRPRLIQPYDIANYITTTSDLFRDPSTPFSDFPINLQKRIPLHLLPKKLIVHDPWNVLSASADREIKDAEKSWSEMTDIVHIYSLALSSEGEKRCQESLTEAQDENRSRIKREFNTTCSLVPEKLEPGPTLDFHIDVKVPPRPSYPTSIPEAHVYFSPAHSIGVGNHSFVYNVEWELPRWLFVEDVIRKDCLQVATKESVEECQRNGKWPSNTFANVGFMDKTGPGDPRVPIEATKNKLFYSGPIVEVKPDVEWYSPERGPPCEHMKHLPGIASKTVRVQVAAKLSKEHDSHLAREAINYTAFPDHFFEHWSGYNIVPPLHDPVPVGPIVPQYYGYYVPDLPNVPPEMVPTVVENEPLPPSSASDHQSRSSSRAGISSDYISPILLVENCGDPIPGQEYMPVDDRAECASLLLKFANADWQHNSFAIRNIVRQLGPLTASRLEREALYRAAKEKGEPPVYSFRLIDFGRSMNIKDGEEGASNYILEKEQAMQLLKLMHWKDYDT